MSLSIPQVQKLAIAGATLPHKGNGSKEIIMRYKTKFQGFSLIEVMIAVLVLSVGILAVTKLQSTLMRSGSDANQRTVATSLAQMKIDDLRAFTQKNNSTYETWGEAIALLPNEELLKTQLAYSHISSNTGGLPTATLIESIPILANYSLSWTVQEYWHTTPLAAPVTTQPTPPPAEPTPSDFKRVTVTVGWNNETGAPQSVALDTLITAYAPALTDLSNNSQNGGEPPRASYTPEAAPDVIDISVDLGTGRKRQTSKPLPDAVSTGPNSNTIVNFEVVTYSSDNSDFVADRKEEFTTVDCNCNLSASTALGYPPGHIIWDGVDRYDNVGTRIEKATATQVNNANAADALCVTCCRDHHDNNASSIKYVAGTTSGDHAHYKADNTEASSGEVYIESCRLKRIDGILRVFQDWSLKDITVMNRTDLTADSTLLTQYVNYQKDFILDSVASTGISNEKPEIRTPINMTLNFGQQLEARGVYIDNVYDLSGTINPASYIDYLEEISNTDRLEIIPFAEVNLSLLANWNSNNTTNVSVTSEPVASIPDPANNYYGAYSRGWVEALSEATPGADITATIRDDNSGLTQVNSTPSPTNISDHVVVNVGASVGAITISGTYQITYPSTKASPPDVSVDGGTDCNVSDNTTPPVYSCSVIAPWSGTITIEVLVNGNSSQRCTGSEDYIGSGISEDTIYDFTLACQ